MEPVKIGIIGCGVISKSHLKLAADSEIADVIAVADIDPARAKSRADEFKIPKHYDGDEPLLDDDEVEAVILAMPTGVRSPVALKALRKKKHVLIEKPIAMNAGEVEQMIELQGDLVSGCCSSRHSFHGHGEAAARCVATGVLGAIRMVRIRALRSVPPNPSPTPPPWRQNMKLNGGGILVNWSCYDLNYVMHVVDWAPKPRELFAQWWPVGPKMSAYVASGSDADSHFTTLIKCDEGITITMERAEFAPVPTDQAWEIIGTDASLSMPMCPQEGKPNAVILNRFVEGSGAVPETVWEAGTEEKLGNIVDDFALAIREGRQPRTDLKRALLMQKITDAIYASAEKGTSVTIQ